MAALSAREPGRASRLRAAVRSEWAKLWSVRSAKAMFGVALVFTLIAGVATCVGYRHAWATMTHAERATFDPTQAPLNGLQLATFLIAVIGVMCISSEFGTGLIRTTFAAMPQRGLVLAAKLISLGAVAWAVGTATCLVTFLAGQGVLSGPVPHATLGQPGVLRAVLGAGGYVLFSGLLGVALGALLRSTGAGIGALIVLLVVLPGIASGLPTSIRTHVMPYLPSEAGHALYVVIRDPAKELPPGGGLAVLAGYAAVALITAIILVRRRDA